MKGRDGARRGFAVGRVPYTGQIVLTDDLRSLRYGSFVTKRLLDFVILAMQAENIELCDASVPEAFSPAEPALGPHGPSRLARAFMLTDSVPRSSTGRLWKRRHFVDLHLLDVVCCLHWIDEDRYAVPMLDLWGHGLHYFDSMRGGVDRHLEIEYAADILAWAETLGKLLGILELMSASTWPVHFHDEDYLGLPRQGRPQPSKPGRVIWDCGCDGALFAGTAIACTARGEQFNFTQGHMYGLRRKAAFMIDNWEHRKGKKLQSYWNRGAFLPPHCCFFLCCCAASSLKFCASQIPPDITCLQALFGCPLPSLPSLQ
jgi:hypothetical protein